MNTVGIAGGLGFLSWFGCGWHGGISFRCGFCCFGFGGCGFEKGSKGIACIRIAALQFLSTKHGGAFDFTTAIICLVGGCVGQFLTLSNTVNLCCVGGDIGTIVAFKALHFLRDAFLVAQGCVACVDERIFNDSLASTEHEFIDTSNTSFHTSLLFCLGISCTLVAFDFGCFSINAGAVIAFVTLQISRGFGTVDDHQKLDKNEDSDKHGQLHLP